MVYAVPITTGEFGLLKVLVTHPRQPLAREKLMLLARGRDHDVFDRAIDVQVSRLRKLIEPDPSTPRYLQTVWGFGYVFIPEEVPARAAREHRGGKVKLWPRSLFGRLALLLLMVDRGEPGDGDLPLPAGPRRAGCASVRRNQDRSAEGAAGGPRGYRP